MKPLKFNLFPILTSKRLLLKQYSKIDYKALFDLRFNATVIKYINRTEENLKTEFDKFIVRIKADFKNNTLLFWIIILEDNSKLVGAISLRNFSIQNETAEIGYELLPNYFGKGIMSEAMEEVLNYGFKELNLKAIEAFTHQDNKRSIDLLNKKGFMHHPNRVDKNNINNVIFVKAI